jgi:hypothetical protein
MLSPTFNVCATIYLSNLLLVRSFAWTQEDVLAVHSGFLPERELRFLKRRLQGAGDTYSGTIDKLFANRNEINRTVQFTENGLIATTTSNDAYVALLIQTHVTAMKNIQFPIRQGDPLFVSLFENIEQTQLDVENITNGVNITNIGFTDCGVILVQEHAKQVSSFVDTGVRQPNFDWTEPDVCDDPTPIMSPVTSSQTPLVSTAPPPVAPTSISPPEETTEIAPTSGTTTLQPVTPTTMPPPEETSPTPLVTTALPPVAPTTIPPEGTTENATYSSICAKKVMVSVFLLNLFISFLY